MPTLLIWHGYRFRFYSSDRAEPPHVHIAKDGAEAKVWLANVQISYNRGFSEPDLRRLVSKVAEHQSAWIGAWDDYFGV